MTLLQTLLDAALLATDLTTDLARASEYDSYDTEGNDGVLVLLAMGPAGAGLVYWSLYRYYRNTDKSHAYERETLIAAQPVTGSDRKVDTRNGTRASSVDDANHTSHRTRVRRMG